MTQQARVGIIVPSYEYGRFLDDCLGFDKVVSISGPRDELRNESPYPPI